MKKHPLPYRNLSELARRSFLPPFTPKIRQENWHEPHPLISYKANTHAFRAAEFTDADTVVLGCSTTFGIGLPLEKTWPFMFDGKLGVTNIIAIPGGSIPQIVDVGTRIMSYFKAPKRVLFLTPNLERLHVAFSPNVDIQATYNWDYNINEFISMHIEKIEALHIESHDGQYRSIPLEFAVSEAYKSLVRLGNLCRLIGAEFYFFSWLDEVNEQFKNSGIQGFVDGESVVPSGPCHEERRETEFWDYAIDYGRHPGEHHHHHYKSRFEAALGLS